MPRGATSDLFDLIHSMTKNEKGYFKKYSSGYIKKGDSKYLKLFDLINKQKKYNEDVLITYFEQNYAEAHFSALKNYLFNLIIDALRSFSTSKKLQVIVSSAIHASEILLSKGLIPSCNKILKRTKRYALGFESYPEALLIIQQELYIYSRTSRQKGSSIETLLKERQDAIEHIRTEERFSSAYWKLSGMLLKYGNQDKKVKSLAEKYIINLKQLSEEEKKYMGFRAQKDALEVKALAYNILLDVDASINTLKTKIALFQKNKYLLKQEAWQRSFFITLSNYISLLISANKENEINDALGDLETFIVKDLKVDIKSTAKAWESLYTMKTRYYIKVGYYDKAYDFLEGFNEQYGQYKKHLSPFNKMRMAHSTILVHFTSGKFDLALEEINSLLSYQRVHNRVELKTIARFLELMIHVELNNNLLVESLVNSIYRLMQKEKTYPLSTTITLKALKDLSSNQKSNPENTINQLEELLITNKAEQQFMKDTLIIPFLRHRYFKTNLQEEVVKYYQKSP